MPLPEREHSPVNFRSSADRGGGWRLLERHREIKDGRLLMTEAPRKTNKGKE
jgi:hypothetical protein